MMSNSDARKRQVETIAVKVTVDTDELRKWADKHADWDHHGVAHVLYKAASDGESLSEQAIREAVEQARVEVNATHRDLVSRLGFGDNITEPMADNDTIVAWVEQQTAEAGDWRETQHWRNDCAAAGHDDDEDCAEHDPLFLAERVRAEVNAAWAAKVEALIKKWDTFEVAGNERAHLWFDLRALTADHTAALDAVKADAAREALVAAAEALVWVRPETCPCDHPDDCCGSEESCDAMRPITNLVGESWLRARAERHGGGAK